MGDRLILVTGATGYIASRLIPRLLERGYRVRALARDPRRLDGRGWSRQIEIFSGEVADPSTLPAALTGVHTAYYLIHNMLSGRGYTVREQEGARNFARAAEAAGVGHIIYLGGLADPEQRIAPHLRSRIETGATLRQGRVPVTEFRAGVVVGSGSISFEMIRFMTELFPIIPGPTWLRNKSQPIATQNVIDYLLAALDHRDGRGGVFEIGGPEVIPYAELMLRYALIRGHKRRMLLLPYIPAWFMALGIGLMTPVPLSIACALVGGLGHDSLVLHDEARRVFPEVNLIDFDSAVREALAHLHPAHIERVWESGSRVTQTLKHEGFFIRHRKMQVDAPPESIFSAAAQMAEKKNWQVEANDSPRRLLVRTPRLRFGEGWLEWHVESPSSSLRDGVLSGVKRSRRMPSKQSPRRWWGLLRLVSVRPTNTGYSTIARNDGTREIFEADSNSIRLTQTAYFAPRGLRGFLYWYWLYPFHAFVFHRLIKAIATKASRQ